MAFKGPPSDVAARMSKEQLDKLRQRAREKGWQWAKANLAEAAEAEGLLCEACEIDDFFESAAPPAEAQLAEAAWPLAVTYEWAVPP